MAGQPLHVNARTTAIIIIINSVLSIPYLVFSYLGLGRASALMGILLSDYLIAPYLPWPLGLVTSMFFDPSILDYVFNMLTLFFIGPFFERRYGRGMMWRVYLISGFFSALSIFLYGPNTFIAGASGALFGMIGFIIALPDRWVILSNPWNVIAIIFLLTPFAASFGIAYLGHLLGFVVGIVYGYVWYRRVVRYGARLRYRYF
ncbi:rhomboid family intramembrane serine protease [Caldivirga sp. UBA161]|uniref:rhomboid family intramembrane serine protease n=1 Tax=Caldivirga sp. UBA161 TaxID=1915569 RepID=UPI0025BA0827|nr:rhomboid family intramembrane serine protease [Caldivirga sp. UBA161]